MRNRQRILHLSVAIATLASTQLARASLTGSEIKGLDQALSFGNMSLSDLNYERKPYDSPFRLPLVNLAIDKPIEAADRLMEMHEVPRTASLSAILSVCQAALDWKPVSAGEQPNLNMESVVHLPEDLKTPVLALINWIRRTNAEIRLALKNVNPTEKRQLIEGLPVIAAEEPGVIFDFVKSPTLSRNALFELVKKVDLPRIQTAGTQLAAAVERAVPLLKAAKAQISAPISFIADGVKVNIYGHVSDQHTINDAQLEIDLGGSDTYLGRHATGVGYASVLIDIGGNDQVFAQDLSMGAGILGVGLAKFDGDSSTFRGESLCFGVGLCGVGAFARQGGNDFYSAKALSEGFSMFGSGVLIDNSGDDTYDLKYMGQGASKTAGIGWLIDRKGRDIYRAGGLILNSPLFADVYYSNAQGYSAGYREDSGGVSGGIGLITDFSGDDTYICETYAQAASYWYALGTLYDGGGHDTYTGYHYCQSSAMHMCGAYLFDLSGDDAFVTKYGASHAIGHDYGVAFFLDRAGNDIYSARDSSPGTGNANGVGIFIDSAGDDRYQGPPGRGNPARSTGSIGVFVDLIGADKYATGLVDGAFAATPQWGFAYDVESAPPKVGTTNQVPNPRPGSIPNPGEAKLEEQYRLATQWAVGTAADSAQKAIQQLIGIGVPALEWMVDKKIEAADHLALRAFEQVAGGIGDEGRGLLISKLFNTTDPIANQLLYVAMNLKMKEASPLLAKYIANEGTQKIAVRAAAEIGDSSCVGSLLPLVANPNQLLAAQAMTAIAQIGSEIGISTAQAVLFSKNVIIRKSAMQLLAKLPAKTFDFVKGLSHDVDIPKARAGIELLGLMGTSEAIREAATRLKDARVEIRIQALLALAGKCPAEFETAFNDCKKDPSPEVRAVARMLEVGR